MREAVATSAVVLEKLESAAHQLKDAAEQLEGAFEPAHRILKDKFGDEAGEVFFDPAGTPFQPPAQTQSWHRRFGWPVHCCSIVSVALPLCLPA